MVEIFSRQMWPGKKGFLPRVMQWLRSNVADPGQRYVWVDSHPASRAPESLRVRSRIVAADAADADADDGYEDYQLIFQPD